MAYNGSYYVSGFGADLVQLGGSCWGSHAVVVRWQLGLESCEEWTGLDVQGGFFIHMSVTWAGRAGTAGGWVGTSLAIWPLHTASWDFFTACWP